MDENSYGALQSLGGDLSARPSRYSPSLPSSLRDVNHFRLLFSKTNFKKTICQPLLAAGKQATRTGGAFTWTTSPMRSVLDFDSGSSSRNGAVISSLGKRKKSSFNSNKTLFYFVNTGGLQESTVELFGIPHDFYDVANNLFLTVREQQPHTSSLGDVLYGYDRRVLLSANTAELLGVKVGDAVLIKARAKSTQFVVSLFSFFKLFII